MQFKVITPIRRDGIDIKPGALLDLPERQAAELLQQGVIESVLQPFSCGKMTLELNQGDRP